MTFVVISDTHGRVDRIESVLSKNTMRDGVLFLGDCLCDVLDVRDAISVRGNCDGLVFSDGADTERMLCFDGVRILMMHGHTHSIKSGTDRAIAYALSKGADVLLYGHTHAREERYYPSGSEIAGVKSERPIYVFNPGSLGVPRDGRPSFGILQIKNGSVLLSHGTV
ncbi:MAG: YfcE family phosphodiesterase [Ruminococcaceae bacterium]|nr:YfcE family phosphodiesterase [Oscillospiraceae bacterium]